VEKEFLDGMMAEFIKDSFRMEKCTDQAHWPLIMADSLLENGKMDKILKFFKLVWIIKIDIFFVILHKETIF